MMMKLRCAAVIVAALCLLCESRGQDGKVLSFTDEGILKQMEICGKVSVDKGFKREGGSGGSLKIEPGATVAWTFRKASGAGKAEFWVYDDGTVSPKPKGYAAGIMWGVKQADAPVLTVGAIYAPYLSGAEGYASSDFIPGLSSESPWQQVQWLGVTRKKGWHKWTFDFSTEKGLSILCDGQAPPSGFNWKVTRLLGFNGLVFYGGVGDAAQTLWISDVSVTLGSEGIAEPLWPPPPPADLAVVPPPKNQTASPYAKWERGFSKDPGYFPIAVWLQSPGNAKAYKDLGINLYIGLWEGPNEAQLAALKEAGMPVICGQNEVGLKHIEDPTIVAWMHGDEPDNAQPFKTYWKEDVSKIKEGWPEIDAFKDLGPSNPYKGYGPPIPPKWIIRDHQEIKKKDPSRPVILNLGQGVAWNGWHGRGERTGKLEDYPEYIKGCDIISFDIYPAVAGGEVGGNLWYVAQGVSRLQKWTSGEKPVWNCIECTHIDNAGAKATPHQVRAEVWMSIIHGSRGLIYFVHQFQPSFIEAGLLADKEMCTAVAAINKQIQELAPVINSPTIADAVTVKSSEPHTPVHAIVKKHGGATYVFAASMYKRNTKASIQIKGLPQNATAEVLGESRKIPVVNGIIQDEFAGYAVHLYRIAGQ